ncbi:unnamed protein product, partial [marine sediment metagenome]
AAAFMLYSPSRFIFYPGSVFITQMFIIGLGCAFKDNNNRLTKKGVNILLVTFFVISFLFSGPCIKYNNNIGISVTSNQQSLFDFIMKNTSSDVIIAGKLKSVNSIPLFTRRKVLISYELSSPWWKIINEEIIIPRLNAISKAYFSANLKPIRKLNTDFDVDYLLVDRTDFEQDTYPNNFIFKPFDKIAREAFDTDKGRWFLKTPPEDIVAYKEDIPRHMHFFTPASVRKYAAIAGLKICKIDSTNRIYSRPATGRTGFRTNLLRVAGVPWQDIDKEQTKSIFAGKFSFLLSNKSIPK